MGFAGEGVGETWLIVVAGGEFDKRRWIPAFAGMTVVIEATSGYRCGYASTAPTEHSRPQNFIPAKAGIQRLSPLKKSKTTVFSGSIKISHCRSIACSDPHKISTHF
jgi:hypothetical protein